jgi:hypothetical protein
LEGDWGCVLIVDAAVEGLVDFRETNLLDNRWWRRLQILANGLARQKEAKSIDAAFRYHLSQVANGSLTEDSFKKSQEQAQDSYHDLIGRIKPWQGKDFISRKKREMTDYRQQYIDAWGVDPTDPAFKTYEVEAIKQAAIALKEKQAKLLMTPERRAFLAIQAQKAKKGKK